MDTKWYIGGLHFACQQCGSCCSGPDEGVIWISRPEINMLAEHLGLSTSQLRENHLKRFGFRYSIKENPCSKDCVFLANINGSRGCTIYDVRPMQCRNWPFWPGNLSSPDDWNAAAVKCPGINPVRDEESEIPDGHQRWPVSNGVNKGRLYSFDEIQKIKKQKQWWNNTNKIICDEVKKIYDWLDSNIKSLNNQCGACGKCCDFESFGHRLFISSPEMVYFSQKNKILPMTGPNCPYQKDNKCTIYQRRFTGCRIFFCKADKDMQNRLSEESIEKFKAMCDKFDFPYRYIDLATALNNPRQERK